MDVCKLPKGLVAGDTLDLKVRLFTYAADSGWTLKFRLVPRDAGADTIEITADAAGADFRVQVAASDTATWTAGFYAWSAWVERASDRVTVGVGAITIQPDPSTLAPGHDGRSENRIAYEAVKAVLAKRATIDQERYMIDVQGSRRELWRTPIADLVKLLAFYRSKVAAEEGRSTFSQAVKVYF